MAALVLGEFSVNSGWFNSEVMLYMAFVAIASYSQASYELGYAVKFMRMINLVMTAIFGVFGYITAVIFCVVVLFSNQTIAKRAICILCFPLTEEHCHVYCSGTGCRDHGKMHSARLFRAECEPYRRGLTGSLSYNKGCLFFCL